MVWPISKRNGQRSRMLGRLIGHVKPHWRKFDAKPPALLHPANVGGRDGVPPGLITFKEDLVLAH
jgi:hypothetical protein